MSDFRIQIKTMQGQNYIISKLTPQSRVEEIFDYVYERTGISKDDMTLAESGRIIQKSDFKKTLFE